MKRRSHGSVTTASTTFENGAVSLPASSPTRASAGPKRSIVRSTPAPRRAAPFGRPAVRRGPARAATRTRRLSRPACAATSRACGKVAGLHRPHKKWPKHARAGQAPRRAAGRRTQVAAQRGGWEERGTALQRRELALQRAPLRKRGRAALAADHGCVGGAIADNREGVIGRVGQPAVVGYALHGLAHRIQHLLQRIGRAARAACAPRPRGWDRAGGSRHAAATAGGWATAGGRSGGRWVRRRRGAQSPATSPLADNTCFTAGAQ